VRRLPEPALAVLLQLRLVRNDDAYPRALAAATAARALLRRAAAAARARRDAPLSPLAAALAAALGGGSLAAELLGPAARSPLGPKKAKALAFAAAHPNPNLRPPQPFGCAWRGKLLVPNDGVVPLFSLDETLRATADALPLQDLLRTGHSLGGDDDDAKGGGRSGSSDGSGV
jgi:hypothetical protein